MPFKALNTVAQRQWIVDKINEYCKVVHGKLVPSFLLSGKPLCKEGWCDVMGISPRQLSRLMKSTTGPTKIEHGNLGKKRCAPKSDEAKAWMKRYFELIGDQMPNCNQIHLPSWETQKDVYQRYVSDMQQQNIEGVVSLKTFYRLWNEDYSHVVIPEVCNVCKYTLRNVYSRTSHCGLSILGAIKHYVSCVAVIHFHPNRRT